MNQVEQLRKAGFAIKIHQWRIDPDTLEFEEEPKLRQEKKLGNSPRGGLTKVMLTSPDGEQLYGEAECSMLDNFCRRTGVSIALGRAMMGTGKKGIDQPIPSNVLKVTAPALLPVAPKSKRRSLWQKMFAKATVALLLLTPVAFGSVKPPSNTKDVSKSQKPASKNWTITYRVKETQETWSSPKTTTVYAATSGDAKTLFYKSNSGAQIVSVTPAN